MALPDVGDIIWAVLDDARGTEQSGRRPALVLSSRAYHEASPRTIICPITSRVRGWPTEVVLPDGLITVGVVLCDQIRTIDRRLRTLSIEETAPQSVIVEVRRRIAGLLGIDIIPSASRQP